MYVWSKVYEINSNNNNMHQNISAWLSALPLEKNRFDLSAFEFKNFLGLR